TYSVPVVPNATTYTWTLPAGWSITGGANTNSITVSTSGAAASGSISVTAVNSCGTSTASSFVVNVTPAVPAQPAPIRGQAAICPNRTLNYYIPDVPNATGYTWTVPSGWTITSGQGTSSI